MKLRWSSRGQGELKDTNTEATHSPAYRFGSIADTSAELLSTPSDDTKFRNSSDAVTCAAMGSDDNSGMSR